MGTSKLQRKAASLLHQYFGSVEIKENYRPEWLTNSKGNGIELDFYLPELGFAIEINGAQHYRFVPFFHETYGDFQKQRAHDDIKGAVCERRGICLVEVASESELLEAIEDIQQSFTASVPYGEYVRLKTLYIQKRTELISRGLKSQTKALRKAVTRKEKYRIKKHIKGHRKAIEKAIKEAERDFIQVTKHL